MKKDKVIDIKNKKEKEIEKKPEFSYATNSIKEKFLTFKLSKNKLEPKDLL